jgi:hypothetical protein
MYYIQETKIQSFELALKRFNKLAFVPTEGASGDRLMGWNNSVFSGEVLYTSKLVLLQLRMQSNEF